MMFFKLASFAVVSAILCDFVAAEDTYMVQSGLDGPCKYDADCRIPSSYCFQQQICQCRAGFVANNSRCAARIGADCYQNNDCSSTLSNSACIQDTCACVDGFIMKPSGDECLPSVSKGEPCTVEKQCYKYFGNNSDCNGNECQCKSRYHLGLNSICVEDKDLFEPCTSSDQCHNNRNTTMVCRDSTCACPEGMVSTDDNKCTDGAPSLIHSTFILLIMYAVGNMF